jgi:hypothetical protein
MVLGDRCLCLYNKNVYGLNLCQLALAQINGISFPCKSKMEGEVVGLSLLMCVCNSPIKKMYGLNRFPITTTATTLPHGPFIITVLLTTISAATITMQSLLLRQLVPSIVPALNESLLTNAIVLFQLKLLAPSHLPYTSLLIGH